MRPAEAEIRLATNRALAPVTSRYGELMRRVLEHYRDVATVQVDGVPYAGQAVDDLRKSWCTNSRIQATRDFLIDVDGRVVMGWHDHPREMWVEKSESPFFDALQRDGLIRYEHVRDSSGRDGVLLTTFERVGRTLARFEPMLTIVASLSIAPVLLMFLAGSTRALMPLFLASMWLCGLSMLSRMFGPKRAPDGSESARATGAAHALLRAWNVRFFVAWFGFLILFTVGFIVGAIRAGELPAFHRVERPSPR